jgi:hypothetical protein
MIGFIARYTFTQLRTAGNTALSLLHKSSPGTGFTTVSLSLQITREVFFAPPNSFLAISSQSPSTAISRI